MTQETPERPKTPVVWVVQESANGQDAADLLGIHQTPDGATNAARDRAAESHITDWSEPNDSGARLVLESEYVTITVTQEKLQR
jgi:hypothetical protein